MVKKRLVFCIKLSQNHVEMCFKGYFFSGCCQHICSVHLESIYWQPTQPTENLREKKAFFIFYDKKYRVHTLRWPQFFFAIFPAEQTLWLLLLRVKVNRENTNEKYDRPCQVQPIFETLAPWLHRTAPPVTVQHRRTDSTPMGTQPVCKPMQN